MITLIERFKGRPSAGAVIGITALVFALGGTAFGSSDTFAKLTKGKVKAIAAGQVDKLAPGLDVNSAKTADSATTATTATTAGSAGIATNMFSVNVDQNGNILTAVPDVATATKPATGEYRVTIGRSLAGCTVSASAANAATSGPDLAIVSVGRLSPANPDVLQVFTRTTANVVADRAFGVQVICPV